MPPTSRLPFLRLSNKPKLPMGPTHYTQSSIMTIVTVTLSDTEMRRLLLHRATIMLTHYTFPCQTDP
jgi:hypothetical protein